MFCIILIVSVYFCVVLVNSLRSTLQQCSLEFCLNRRQNKNSICCQAPGLFARPSTFKLPYNMHDGRLSELLSQPSFLGIMNISQAIKRYSTGLQIEVFMLWKPRPALDEICEKKLEYKSVTVGALGVPDIRFTGHQRGATNRPNKIGGKFEKTKQNKWIKLMKSKNGGQTNEEKTKQKQTVFKARPTKTKVSLSCK